MGMTNVNQSITASKRKLEGELGQLNSDLDEMTNEARLSEEKAARSMVDAARIADELRCEQELAMNLEKDKKLLEAQCKDAATRADEAEVNALKGGRKAMIKMETRIRELESELDAETRRFVTSPRTSASPRGPSRSWPLPPTRIARTTRGCRPSLTS